MRTLALLMLAVGLASFSLADDKKDPLSGKWIVESVTREGTSDEGLVGAVRLHEGDKYSVTPKEGSKSPAVKGTFTISSSKAHSTMDMKPSTGRYKDKTLLAIYKLEGDELKVCFAEPGKDRPSAFESKPGSGWVLAIHKKAK
jgi:uncharacterized protein (TIGR03067 family)